MQSLKIVIDARWMLREMSGIGVYTRELIRQFVTMDRDNHYLLLFNDPAVMNQVRNEMFPGNAHNFDTRLIDCVVFSIKSQLVLPGLLTREKADVFHSPNYMIPLPAFPRNGKCRTKCVATIHDVIPLIFPDHAPKSRKSRIYPVYRLLMREIGRRAHAIITVSDASRRDVISQLHIPVKAQTKVVTIYNGVSEQFSVGNAERRLHDSGRERIVLYVGRSDPYKNLPLLVRAFAKAKTKCKFPLRLIIAGQPDSRYPEAQQLVKSLGLDGNVNWTGYLDNDLVNQYHKADLLAHPSLYEGFGLQVAEAMSCGLPVVCTDAGSLPEITGNAAIIVRAGDEDAFCAGMIQVLTDPELACRLSQDGPRQAARFTWQQSAKQTLAIYRKTAEGN